MCLSPEYFCVRRLDTYTASTSGSTITSRSGDGVFSGEEPISTLRLVHFVVGIHTRDFLATLIHWGAHVYVEIRALCVYVDVDMNTWTIRRFCSPPPLPQATGYGVVEFAKCALEDKGDTLKGKRCLITGSGKVYTAM